MRAGRRDRRITFIKRVVGGKDEWGRHSPPTWEPVATVSAEVKEVVSRERTNSPQVMAVRAANISIRYRKDIHPAMRILWDGQTWEIKGMAELGRRRDLQILAEMIEVKDE